MSVSCRCRVTLDRHSTDDSLSSSTASTSAAATLEHPLGTPPSFMPAALMTPPPSASSLNSNTSSIGSGGAGSASDTCDLPTDSEELNITRESVLIRPSLDHSVYSSTNHAVGSEISQPSNLWHSPLHMHNQHRSYSSRLQRTPSISSQGSLDSAPSRHSTHRGSSPQIRTFGPDGRSSLPLESAFPHLSRSSSPFRTISLDTRCCSPVSFAAGDRRPSSTSQGNMASLASGVSPGVPLISPKIARSLSPLLLPSTRHQEAYLGPSSPLGALQPDLYRIQDGPIYITAPETCAAIGRLHLRINYDSNRFDLTVHMIEAENLCPIKQGGFRDPYVRLMLEPAVDNRQRQTQIHRGSSDPYFDEHFKFQVSRDQLLGKELIIHVLDYDRYSNNDIVGELRIAMDDIELSNSVEIWGDLVRTKNPQQDRPELLCTLNYLPQAERLTVAIMKAKNLETMQGPHVKVYLIQNGKRIKKKKTSPSKSDDPTNPVWNEAFTFKLQSNLVTNSSIEIFVVGAGGEANAIGSCGIGPQERGTGCQHWHDMINNARKPTAMWHIIR